MEDFNWEKITENQDEAAWCWKMIRLQINSAFKGELENSPLNNPKVLDVGAGDGEFVKYLDSIKVNVVAVDIKSKDKIDDIAQVQADVHQLPFSDQSFNIVNASALFDKSVYVQNTETIIKEICRVLTNEGVLVIFNTPQPSAKILEKYFQNKGLKDISPALWQKLINNE